MKTFNLMAKLGKVLLASAVALPLAVSCMDDINDLKDKVTNLENRLNELELRLNQELAALEDLINGKITIAKVNPKDDGSYGIELSTGVDFTIYPKQEQLKTVVTYITLGGVNYWAYYDENGDPQLLLNEKGERIPVENATPQVVVKDGESFLVIGEQEYPLSSGNSVFSDYELHMDELTGEVRAVTFTFGEGMTFTVTVDGYQGLTFVIQRMWDYVPVEDFFIAYGTTEKVTVQKNGVVDYVLQIPDGWRVKEVADDILMETYFQITAPTLEAVKAGAASEGELKVVSVLEGGKASVSKLYVSADPFRDFGIIEGKAVTKMYTGLQKFVYGVCLADDFNEETLLPVANELLLAYEYPAGYGVADFDLEMPLEDIYGEELIPGETYVFWAAPALYFSSNVDAYYYVAEGTFVHKDFSYTEVSLEVSDPTFRDATVEFDSQGVKSYYAGVMYMNEYAKDDVLLYINNNFYEPIVEPYSYMGSAFGFGYVEAEPEMNTDYLVWFAVAEEGKIYTEADVIFREFSTSGLESGSAVKVEAGTAEITSSKVTVPLTAEGAEMVFYSYVKYSNAGRYPDDAAKSAYLLANGICVNGESAEAVSDALVLDPLETVYLFAVAVDGEGKYGEVYTGEYTTIESSFNDMTVDLEVIRNNPYDVAVSVDVTGGNAEGYLYWVGKATDTFWKSSSNLGGSKEKAQDYMLANPNNAKLITAMRKYPLADGVITMADLALETEYVVVVMAKDAEGVYSEATVLIFTTRAVDLGEIIYSSNPVWSSFAPTIDWIEERCYPSTGMMSGSYAFNISIPEGLTAYVLCGTEAYLNDGNPDAVIPIEDRIIKILEFADHKRDADKVVDEQAWIDQGYPYGHEFYSYYHGYPAHGYGVIWASREAHEKECENAEPDVVQKVINGVTVDCTTMIYYSTDGPVEFRMPDAITKDDLDKVYVVYRDAAGNYFEPHVVDVPDELFASGGSRD